MVSHKDVTAVVDCAHGLTSALLRCGGSSFNPHTHGLRVISLRTNPERAWRRLKVYQSLPKPMESTALDPGSVACVLRSMERGTDLPSPVQKRTRTEHQGEGWYAIQTVLSAESRPRFLSDRLGADGEAVTVDVRRDVDAYYAYAREQGLTIGYAADTHQHNDYLTGITELQGRSSVELLASARADLGYEARRFDDTDRLRLGEVDLEVIHTPGHTPEHISFLVRDLSRGDDPIILLSGGALLVNDLARPDLLGEPTSTRQGAQDLATTLRDKILPLPDHVMVFPTHVAGSLCGGNIGSMLFTTIGYERRLNHLVRCIVDDTDFESECLNLNQLPTVPAYWKRMRKQNQDGPAPLGILAEPSAMRPDAVERHIKDGALVLDCRQPEAFGGAHVPGALNVGLGTAFATWAGTVVPPDVPLILVLDDPADLWEASWQLLRIGYDLPIGWLAGGMAAWRVSGKRLDHIQQWSVSQLDAHMQSDKSLFVLDVRQPKEWHNGHVPNAYHIPGGELPARLDEVPRDQPVAVYCGSGYRSSVATSLLRQAGRDRVFNVLGGFSAWIGRGKSGRGIESR